MDLVIDQFMLAGIISTCNYFFSAGTFQSFIFDLFFIFFLGHQIFCQIRISVLTVPESFTGVMLYLLVDRALILIKWTKTF